MTDAHTPTEPVASHTPGPWWVERRVGDALQVNAEHRGKGSSYCVASLNHWEGEADRANARLIAAAPDMLFALKRVRRLWAKDDACEETRLVDEALAKAEGRS